VVTVLLRRWRLPSMLSRPIEWHHTRPGDSVRSDDQYHLQRIAYYVGAIDLVPTERSSVETAPLSVMGSRVLGVAGDVLAETVRRASSEYLAASAMFAQVAENVADVDGLSARVHNQLSELLDVSAASLLGQASEASASSFQLGVRFVEPGDHCAPVQARRDGL